MPIGLLGSMRAGGPASEQMRGAVGLLGEFLAERQAMARRRMQGLLDSEWNPAKWQFPVDMAAGEPTPEQAARAQTNLAGSLGDYLGAGVSQTVFHGTPHRWAPEPGAPLGRPSLGKAGTGEGGAAFGHGFYAAENQGTADYYRRMLGKPRPFIGDQPLPMPNNGFAPGSPEAIALNHLEFAVGQQSSSPYTFAARDLRRQIAGEAEDKWPTPGWLKDGREKALEVLGDWESRGVEIRNTGSLVKLDLADEAIPKMLPFDRQVRDWSPEVRKKVEALIDEMPEMAPTRWNVGVSRKSMRDAIQPGMQMTGEDIYRKLSDAYGTPEAASEALRKAGIPGIRFLDAMSRGAGKGTSNYVVFDTGLLNVLGRE